MNTLPITSCPNLSRNLDQRLRPTWGAFRSGHGYDVEDTMSTIDDAGALGPSFGVVGAPRGVPRPITVESEQSVLRQQKK